MCIYLYDRKKSSLKTSYPLYKYIPSNRLSLNLQINSLLGLKWYSGNGVIADLGGLRVHSLSQVNASGSVMQGNM